ncbi:MAG: hypothetical protein ACP5F1_03765 [Thermoplasmata archaeon]|nr:hypothetical protein [Thermoplasmata archaeon]
MDLKYIVKKLKNSEGNYLIKIKTKKGPIELENELYELFKNLGIKNIISHWSPYSRSGLIEILCNNLNIYIEWYAFKDESVILFKKIDNYDVSAFDEYLSSLGIENYVLRLMRMEF